MYPLNCMLGVDQEQVLNVSQGPVIYIIDLHSVSEADWTQGWGHGLCPRGEESQVQVNDRAIAFVSDYLHMPTWMIPWRYLGVSFQVIWLYESARKIKNKKGNLNIQCIPANCFALLSYVNTPVFSICQCFFLEYEANVLCNDTKNFK